MSGVRVERESVFHNTKANAPFKYWVNSLPDMRGVA
jgi:hypothetical protein